MYAINPKTNKEMYPKSSNNIEFYYKNIDDKETYITENNIQNYAFNFPQKEEVYAQHTISHGKLPLQYYSKFDHKEIYAIDIKNNFEKFINVNNQDQYAKNKYELEFYPLDFVGRNKVAKNQTGYFYANGNSEYFYPINEYGNEFAVPDQSGDLLIITSQKGLPVVPKKRDGSVHYMTFQDDEIPYMYNKTHFVGKNSAGDGQYPRNKFQDEYYPDNNLDPKFATDSQGKFKYAVSARNTIIYPIIADEEIYIEDDRLDSYTNLRPSFFKNFTQYIRQKDKEFYPVKISKNDQFSEMIINNLYSKHDTKFYYPKDSYKNEYANSLGNLLDSYPITLDGHIILPNYNNNPQVKSNDSQLLKQIKCLLYRPEFKRYDFLLNCSSNKYPLLHSKSFSCNNLFKYVIAALCTIVFILFFILVM